MNGDLLSKVRGCVTGATIGDTIGAVVEFADRENVRARLGGKEWVDDMYPLLDPCPTHPLGIFSEHPPKGTGTDDTRLNHAFIECVVKNNGMINPQLLAIEYINRYRRPERYYPKAPELARQHMAYFYNRSCARLGMSGVDESDDGFLWTYLNDINGIPTLAGLLHLQSTGLLCKDDPEGAYRKAVVLNFFDIGYASDATAILAAVVSAALGNAGRSAPEVLDIGMGTNPFEIGRPDGTGRRMVGVDPMLPDAPSVPKMVQAAEAADSDEEAMVALARVCAPLHPFDPLEVLGVPLAIIRRADGDPVRSVLMAANHRKVDEDGNLIAMRDVDCIAMVTGVIVGAINGVEAFPDEWVQAVQEANREVYNIDIDRNARDLFTAVYEPPTASSFNP
jgi:ADP-ribosylglycohydrolase